MIKKLSHYQNAQTLIIVHHKCIDILKETSMKAYNSLKICCHPKKTNLPVRVPEYFWLSNMHLEMGSSTTFQVRIHGNEERKCMYRVDWVWNVSLFGDQRYFCTIGKYFPWWKQKCLEIVFQTFFSATKDISNLFTLFYIMILVFVRSLHSQPVR